MEIYQVKTSLLFLLVCLLGLNSCGDEDPEPACPPSLSLSVTDNVPATCESADGALMVEGNGGAEPYEYALGDNDLQSSGVFTDLPEGIYPITVRDANGCTTTNSFTVGSSVPINVNATSTNAGCETSNAIITVTVTGATGDVSYQLDGGNAQDDNTFSGVDAGIHNITVSDDSGCENETEIQVLSGVSFSATVLSIITENCATPGCHVTGTGLPNYEIEDEILSRAQRIKIRTQAGEMPPPASGVTLTAEELAAIACWADDGGPNN